ncbi:MAG TPA: SWIM zinc finger family protein [Anaerolineales bacterium]
MALPKITESIIRAGAGPESFRRGEEYYRDGAISNAAIQGSLLSGECAGTYAPYYRVKVELDEAGIAAASCTCLYEYGGYCKHIVALLLAYLYHPKSFAARKAPAELLADLDHNDLVAILTKLMQEQPELCDRIEALSSVPSKPGKKCKKVDIEAHRLHIIAIVHSLDGMRMSEAYWHVGDLANQLREVQQSAAKFLDAGDAETALEILLVLLEEASRAIEYVDDSNGELGSYVGELGTLLAESILSTDLSQVERAKLTGKLEKLIQFASDYGMEGNLRIAVQAAKFGWDDVHEETATLRRTVSKVNEGDEWDEDHDWDEEAAYELHEWDGPATAKLGDLTEAKLNVLDRQGRTEDYLALCKKEQRHLRYTLKLCDLKQVTDAVGYAKKHLASAEEMRQVALRLRESRLVAEAIEVGERGLKLKGPKAGLGEWLGPIEEVQGRTKQALAAWMAAFSEHPSLEAYKTIKRLAESDWGRLCPEVMTKLRKSYDKQVLVEVLLFEEEWGEAIKVAEDRDMQYPIIEEVADGVMPHRPEWVAQVSLKHAERLMAEVKSKNYPIAAAWLKRAKEAHRLLGKTDEWKKYLAETKEKYKRRPALQNQLARL